MLLPIRQERKWKEEEKGQTEAETEVSWNSTKQVQNAARTARNFEPQTQVIRNRVSSSRVSETSISNKMLEFRAEGELQGSLGHESSALLLLKPSAAISFAVARPLLHFGIRLGL